MLRLRLKELREREHISQAKLAKELGVSQSTVGMWENGKNNPEYDTLLKVADYFDVSVDYLTGNDPNDPFSNLHTKGYLEGKSIIRETISDLKIYCKKILRERQLSGNDSTLNSNLESIIESLTKINSIAEDEIIIKEMNSEKYNKLLYEYIIVNMYFEKYLSVTIKEESIDLVKLKKEAEYALGHVRKNIDDRIEEITIVENIDTFNFDKAYLDKNRNIDISENYTIPVAAHLEGDLTEEQKKFIDRF